MSDNDERPGECADCGEVPGDDGVFWKRRRKCPLCTRKVCPSCYHHFHARHVAAETLRLAKPETR